MKPEGINSLNPRNLGLAVNKLGLTFPKRALCGLHGIKLNSELR